MNVKGSAPRLLLLSFACAASAFAFEKLDPATLAAFDRYVERADARIEAQVTRGDGFLVATTPKIRASLQAGRVLTEAKVGRGDLHVPSGLIHDWAGAVFLPGVSIGPVLDLLRDYERHPRIFRPEVIRAELLSHEGNDFRVRLRLVKVKAVTVVLDTEHTIHYERRDENRWWSRSRATRISEIESPGTPQEKALPPGTGRGFVWALRTWWTFQQLDGGVYVECEALSLSRDIPKGLAWLIEPIIRSFPRESLENTLRATRAAMVPQAGR